MNQKQQLYQAIISKIFLDRYFAGATQLNFQRSDIINTAQELEIPLPKNVGDVVYSFRYRRQLPTEIVQTQPEGLEWIIEGMGRARYAFKLVRISRILPNPELQKIQILDATPAIIAAYALSDEQALLAQVRYNRLIDIFLGIVSYSLQNHLRTTVKNIGQIEIDEIYVGLDTEGCQYVIPVQAKIGNDKLGVVQTKQDIRFCQEKSKFRDLICRPVAAQFMDDGVIALFELQMEDNDRVEIVRERHYELIPYQP